MTLLQQLGYKDVKWREMTLEQRREYDKLRYAKRREQINARRRELYRLKKEQQASEHN